MNVSIIFKLLSVISLTLTGCFGISFGVECFMNPQSTCPSNTGAWIACIGIGAAVSLLLYMLGYQGDTRIFRREAMATIGLGWVVASLLGALPYMLLIPGCSFADAVFESASGLTTTGASIFSDFSVISPGLMFWRCLSQWVGGLGVVVFFVALLSFLGAGAKILYSNEASAQANELDATRVQLGVLRIFGVYSILSLACMIAYHAAGMNWYDSVLHMFTTLSTGGFSNHGESMAYFQSPLIEWICTLFMVLGGTSFVAILRFQNFKRGDLKRITEVYVYYGIVICVTALMALFLIRAGGWNWSELHQAVRDSAFQVVSIMTTTGFATANYQQWVPVTHILLLCLMVIGGCSGSTAGGVKVVRIIVALKVCLRQIERSYRAHVVRPIKINARVMDETTLEQGTVFLLLATGVCIISFPLLAIMQPEMSAAGTISTVLASLFNIGPGLNEIGPTQNFGFMHDYTKLFLSILMILGRLELYALLALFMPGMWRRFS